MRLKVWWTLSNRSILYNFSCAYIDYYVKLAKEVEDMGADSLCIKDMAGILLPTDAYNLIKALKQNTKLPINLHGHATAGIMEATYIKAIEAGVDIIDTALSPLSGGTSQVATESFYHILKDTPYDTQLNIDLLKKAADKLTVIKDEYLNKGLLNPKALTSNPNILEYQVPGGGMLSNLIEST